MRKPNRYRGIWIIIKKGNKRKWEKIGYLWSHGEVDLDWEKLKQLGIIR